MKKNVNLVIVTKDHSGYCTKHCMDKIIEMEQIKTINVVVQSYIHK